MLAKHTTPALIIISLLSVGTTASAQRSEISTSKTSTSPSSVSLKNPDKAHENAGILQAEYSTFARLIADKHTRDLLPRAALDEADRGHYKAALAIIKKEALKNKSLMNWVEQNAFNQVDAKAYGIILLHAGDINGAVKYLRQAVIEHPQDLQANIALAESLEKKGDIYQAVSYLRTALKLDSNNQYALTHLARILSWHSSGHAEAAALLARDLRLYPNDLNARRELATINSWTKNSWAKAIEQFRAIIKQDAGDTKSKLALGRLLSWIGQFQESEAVYSSYLLQRPDDVQARREFARLLTYHSDTWPKAIEQYDLALKVNESDLETAYDRALLLAYTNRADESMSELTRLADKTPFGLVRTNSAYGLKRPRPILFTLAQVQNWSSRWSEAEKNLRKYLAKAADDWGAQLELARSLSCQPTKIGEALSLLDQVLASHPDCSSAQSEKAMLEAIRGSFGQALPTLQAVASRDPFGPTEDNETLGAGALKIKSSGSHTAASQTSEMPILDLARVASWANHWVESEKAYRIYLEKYPNDSQVRLELAKILGYQPQRLDDAMKEYNQVLQIDPQNKGAILQKLILEAVSGHIEEATLALKKIVDEQSVSSLTDADQSPLLQLARLLSWTPHTDDAEKYYRQFLAKHPEDNNVSMELATLLSYKPENRKEAIVAFSNIIKSEENNDKALANRARFRRAITLAWQKEYDLSLTDLDILIANDYQDALSDQVKSAYLTPLLAKAQILTWAGKRVLSEEAYEKYLATNAGAHDKIARLELAELYGQKQETYQKAMNLLNALLEKDHSDFLTRQAKAKMLVRMGDLEPASREFDNLLTEHPAYIELHKQAALANELSGHGEISIQHWQQILALRPHDPEATLAVVLALTKEHCLPAAEKLATDSLSQNSTAPQPYIALALVVKEQGYNARADQLIEQAIAIGKTRDLLEIANQLSGPKVGRYVAATICQKILDNEPENARANLLLACIQIWSPSERSKGLSHLKYYLKLHPEDVQAEAFLAEVLSWGKNRNEALNILDKLIAKNPQNLEVRNQRAKLLTWTGKLSQAIKEYKTILALDSKNVTALVGLGQCANYNGDYYKAEKYLKLARQQDQKDAQAQLVSAINFNQMGRVDKALDHLKTILTVAHEARGFTFSTLEGENEN